MTSGTAPRVMGTVRQYDIFRFTSVYFHLHLDSEYVHEIVQLLFRQHTCPWCQLSPIQILKKHTEYPEKSEDNFYQLPSKHFLILQITGQHLSLRIIVTKHSGNSHKWGVMEVIAPEVVGNDFKDFYQTGRRWGDTITRRKLIYDKLLNLFSMSFILE